MATRPISILIHGLRPAAEIVEVFPAETAAGLLRRLKEHGHEIDLDVAILSFRDADDDLRSDVVLVEILESGSHVHIHHHCPRINVEVRFPPHAKTHEFRANKTIGKILAWAEHEFGIIPGQRGQYRLKLPTAIEYLDNDLHVGELVKQPPCELRVDLVRIEQNAGS